MLATWNVVTPSFTCLNIRFFDRRSLWPSLKFCSVLGIHSRYQLFLSRSLVILITAEENLRKDAGDWGCTLWDLLPLELGKKMDGMFSSSSLASSTSSIPWVSTPSLPLPTTHEYKGLSNKKYRGTCAIIHNSQHAFFLYFLQLYCHNGISPMEICVAFPRGKPAVTVTLPNLRCTLGVLVFP